MKTNIVCRPFFGELLRRAGLATARLALRKAGALLRASSPQVVRAGEKLEALSEHPNLKGPPPGFHV